MDNNFLVRVSCMTYNHAPYIEDAMNGFCMQETNFPFVCTIMDDASIDGEPEVIKKYLQEHFDLEDKSIVRNEETDDYVLTFARHKINHNCFFAVLYLKYNHYSIKKSKITYIQEWHDNCKYIALCEGDDYWIAPNKLQKQVSFLESHNDYVMCFHNAFITKVCNKRIVSRMFNTECEESDLLFEEAIVRWWVPTASMLYRNHILEERPSWLVQIYSGDLSLIMRLTLLGSVRYDYSIMSVYRNVLNGESVSQKVKGAFYYEQKIELYNSFLKCPTLTDSQRKALHRRLCYYKKIQSYVQYKDKNKYIAFLVPQYWSIILQIAKIKLKKQLFVI